MIHETLEIAIDYNSLGIKHDKSRATITTYIKDSYPNDQDKFNRPLIVIFPGGGYHHTSVREAEPIALKMLDYGFNAVIVRYSLMPNTYPCQLYEAAYAMHYVRTNASKWDVNPDNIVIAGFSAGGHVAGLLATKWNSKEVKPILNMLKCDNEFIKPNKLMLGYPVISSGEFAHRASFERLIYGGTKNELEGQKLVGIAGQDGDLTGGMVSGDRDYLYEELSLEKCVTSDTPKTFMWHTVTDASVPVNNSLLFAQALLANNIPFEYHVFPKGSHGLALGTKETASKNLGHYEPRVSIWTDMFKDFVMD
ncbi:alpha/beta hydrolase [Lachnospira multipara]|uniref:alpha/beta hydrolase n=1 Tax=Lachnospira multipara TaxID=28051 RepID=UPI0004E227E8|nr:alpha/beta hydrolase [Lachnospira multipara]